jgi:sterol desaturase/sphingolipid hydroxylase (fatty acid hydroxylase superfamily)
MKGKKIHNKGQARIFENPFLELLTKSHPLVIWGMYIPILSYFIYLAATTYGYSTSRIILTFLGGILFWTFFEYVAHRYIFHWVSENPKIQRFAYVLHGNHHDYPRDRQRLFMPPVPSLLISSTIFGIMYLVMGPNAFVFLPGFIIGYLLYGTIHYAIHAWNPPFKWMKPLWRNHHLHHYKDENHGFGVSSTIWDHVFGTMFDLKNIKDDKEKVAELRFKNEKAEAQAQ